MDQEERPQTGRSLLLAIMGELLEAEFKMFKFLLKESQVPGAKSNIPASDLETADPMELTDLMVAHYDEKRALLITQDLLSRVPRNDLLTRFRKDFQKYLPEKTLMEAQVKEDRKRKYKEYVMEAFRSMKEQADRMGEHMILNERYAKLLILKKYRPEKEKKHELRSCGKRHLEMMAKRSTMSYSCIGDFFAPEKDWHVHRTVVLQGAAGIGKTTTARKIMLDWGSGELFQDRFEYVFYIHCREHNQSGGLQTIADLISHSCDGEMPLSMDEIEADPKTVLFIIDGFDELKVPKDFLHDSKSPGEKTLIHLIRKRYLSQSYLLITTRPTAVETLMQCVKDERFAEILGFSEEERKEYFSRFFKNEFHVKAFKIVKENEVLFTMCFVPIVCWIVCTVLQQQMEEHKDFVYASRTTTSVYMSFLSSALAQQCSGSEQPITGTSLKRLCALANEGVYEQKVLFTKEDITRHGLDMPAIRSLFLNNHMFKKIHKHYTLYSFLHLSFQEFFAALFYLLGEDKASAGPGQCPEGDVKSLLDDYRNQKQNHLALTVRFLFGLLNKEGLEEMEETFKWKTSSDLKPTLQTWIQQEIGQGCCEITDQQMDLLHCLYEIQDKEFVEQAMEHVEAIQVTRSSLQRKLSVMDCRVLAFCVKNAPVHTNIDISDIPLTLEHVRALTPGLAKCPSLRLAWCEITGSCCAALSPALKQNQSLTELDLSDNELGGSGVTKLCEVLKDTSCKIQKLGLQRCCLTGSCCAALSSVLKQNHSFMELNLRWNELGDSGMADLCKGLKDPSCKIHKLWLVECSLTGSCCAALSSVLKQNQSLMELDLSWNKLGDSGVTELCEGLKDPGCKMQKLGLAWCEITGSCCADLSSVLKQNQSLTELDLSDNILKDSGVTELCEGLKYPGCKIQKLRLDSCNLTGSCCAALSSALKQNQSLTELELTVNDLGDSGVTELCEGLKDPGCRIQTLGLAWCKLTGSCCAALSSVLKQSPSFSKLGLSGNELEDSGVTELCDGLKDPGCKIQTLWMDDCSLTGASCADLCSVLRTNTSLTEIELRQNHLNRSEVRKLHEAAKNKSIRLLMDLEGESESSEVEAEIS
ncbi:NACHT, LRR and PYD domains-containing protein 3-like isoform X2 [Ambystoma mexicanum]